MRLTVIALATLLAAPAFAQEVPGRQTPPPEGFYRNIDGVYDLLARPYAINEIRRVDAPEMTPQLLKRFAASRAAPLPPPCEPPLVANGPANKPPRPAPCPSAR